MPTLSVKSDAASVLTLWETALGKSPMERDDALLAAITSDGMPKSLGERNACLLTLHEQLFGRDIDLLSHCPACGATAQFGADATMCSPQALNISRGPYRLESNRHSIEFRIPDVLDVTAAADSSGEFVQALLKRCVVNCTKDDISVPVDALPDDVLNELSVRMEALDPGSVVSFAIECPACATSWNAVLDVGETVWRKVRASAERLLLDIDTLARAYGWTQSEILSLSPLRRAAFLQLTAA